MVRLRSPAPILRRFLGEFPSGQRGQTVNLLSLTSLVRIQLPPPKTRNRLSSRFFCFCRGKRFRTASLSPTRIWFALFPTRRVSSLGSRRKKPRIARIQSFPKVKLFAFIWTPNRCPFLCFSKNLRKI